ncbi:neuronal acetylcholine receptor subunit alpha-3-like [Tropilaelaps mercedesae]|uniref:Neuronal acetylcholine receptor subunit alpha-3-like n=1 Tax=Tropilaelaps mercedesae TaxID=418985 RepID=A0A1V9XBK5_9ACAR|nr:neuronal acetylcholine receptor subunit alpha-3-like [Tropilaelaps mercedesae]
MLSPSIRSSNIPSIFLVNTAVLLVTLMGLAPCSVADEQEYRLTRYLMSNYDPAVRPSENASLPLQVKINVLLQKIQQLEYETNTVKASWKVIQRWNDAHLRWNASDFGGIAILRIPSKQVWRPDVVLLNGNTAGVRESHAVVHSSGEIVLLEERNLHSWCHFNKLHLFPFEVHLCRLAFASWAYDASQITMEVHSLGVDGELFVPSLEFVHHVSRFPLSNASSSSSSHSSSVIFGIDTMARSTVQLQLRLHRRSPLGQLLCFLLPVVLANLMAVVAFFVPATSGQRLTISTQSLLILCGILVYMHRSIPTMAERVPLLVVYAAWSAVIVAASLLCSVLTLNVHSQSGCRLRPSPVPRGFRRLVKILAKIFVMDCCGVSTVDATESAKKEKSPLDTPKTPVEFTTDHIEHYNFSPSLRSHRKQFLFETPASAMGTLGGDASEVDVGNPMGGIGGGVGDCGAVSDLLSQTMSLVWQAQAPPLLRLNDTVVRFDDRLREDERRREVREEWRTLSLLCDRVLLAVFLLVSALTAALVLVCST